MKTWFEIKNAAANEAEIRIYDYIGMWGVTADDFVRELATVTAPTLHVRVNSNGGSAFEAFAIYNALKRHPAKVISHVDGVAASAATYPVLAASEVRMAKNAMLMIHDPAISVIEGDAEDLRNAAGLLDKLKDSIAGMYADETGQPRNVINQWMTQTKWLNSEEAIDAGFADAIDGEASEEPMNRSSEPRVRVADRVKALELAGLLPVNAATNKESSDMITAEQFAEFAAKNPDAVKNVAKDLIEQAREAAKNEVRNELKPKNASAAELKAAFPDNRDFVLDRLDHDAPLNEHKVAFADYLAEQNKALQQEIETLKNKIAELDPGQAGEPNPLNLNKPNEGGDKPMSDERKRELLNMSPLGTAVLNRK